MATGSCQGIMRSIATTEILPWLQLAAVMIVGKNGAGALHTRIRPFSVGPSRCAADSTVQDYHQAVYTRPLNTIADPDPSPIAMPAQHQLHFLRP